MLKQRSYDLLLIYNSRHLIPVKSIVTGDLLDEASTAPFFNPEFKEVLYRCKFVGLKDFVGGSNL